MDKKEDTETVLLAEPTFTAHGELMQKLDRIIQILERREAARPIMPTIHATNNDPWERGPTVGFGGDHW